MASAKQLSYGFFFFNDTATTEIYTLSLHDALPICRRRGGRRRWHRGGREARSRAFRRRRVPQDRKSTRLNSSHLVISYAVFCLKKKRLCTAKTPPRPLTSRSNEYHRAPR